MFKKILLLFSITIILGSALQNQSNNTYFNPGIYYDEREDQGIS